MELPKEYDVLMNEKQVTTDTNWAETCDEMGIKGDRWGTKRGVVYLIPPRVRSRIEKAPSQYSDLERERLAEIDITPEELEVSGTSRALTPGSVLVWKGREFLAAIDVEGAYTDDPELTLDAFMKRITEFNDLIWSVWRDFQDSKTRSGA